MPLYRKYCTVEVKNETEREDSVREILVKLKEEGIDFNRKG